MKKIIVLVCLGILVSGCKSDDIQEPADIGAEYRYKNTEMTVVVPMGKMKTIHLPEMNGLKDCKVHMRSSHIDLYYISNPYVIGLKKKQDMPGEIVILYRGYNDFPMATLTIHVK